MIFNLVSSPFQLLLFALVLFALKMGKSVKRSQASSWGKGKATTSKGGDGIPTALPLTGPGALKAGMTVLESSEPKLDWGGQRWM